LFASDPAADYQEVRGFYRLRVDAATRAADSSSVHCPRRQLPHSRSQPVGWDTHAENFSRLRDNLPVVDRAVSALLEDLSVRGMLDDTLVMMFGEFGRTPRINAQAGRDHWAQAMSIMLAGGGVPAGLIHGATDRNGAFVTQHSIRRPTSRARFTRFWASTRINGIQRRRARKFQLSAAGRRFRRFAGREKVTAEIAECAENS